MAWIGIALSVASSVSQAQNTAAAGKAEQAAGQARGQALEHQAAQARQSAGQERASAQRAASEKRRLGRLLSSRALAVAAASGAGAGDPTVENILGDIGAEGEFRALTEMFIGEERARGLETRADLLIFEAQQERRGGNVARSASEDLAFQQLLSGGAKAFGSASDAGLFKKKTTTASSGQGLSRYG